MGERTGPPRKAPAPPPRPKPRNETLYSGEYDKWKEYSAGCPWRFTDLCKACAMVCKYTTCAPWHFLKIYKKQIRDKYIEIPPYDPNRVYPIGDGTVPIETLIRGKK